MFKVLYGCNVHNQFEECPAEASDPFELLSDKLKKQSSGKEKKSVGKKASEKQKVAVTVVKTQPSDSRQQLKDSSVNQIQQASPQSSKSQEQIKRKREVPPHVEVQSADVAYESVTHRSGQQAGELVHEKPYPSQQYGRGARSDRGRGTFSGGPRRREGEGNSSGGYDSLTFHRGGRGGRYDGDGGRGGSREGTGGRGRGYYRGSGYRAPQIETSQVEVDLPDVLTGEVEYTAQPPRPPFRGRPRFGSGPEGGKRQFDRHSGSNRTTYRPADKRHGGGAHNWGKPVEDSVEDPVVDSPSDSGDRPENIIIENELVDVVEDQTEERAPSPILMTLDEYREQQKKNKSTIKTSVRQAGEGEDLKKWGKHVQAYRKKPREPTKYTVAEEINSGSEDEEYEESHNEEMDQESNITKQIVSTLFIGKPAPSNRQSRGRGFRGSNRTTGGTENRREFSNRGRGSAKTYSENDYSFSGHRGGFSERREDSGPYENIDIREDRRKEKLPDMADFPELC